MFHSQLPSNGRQVPPPDPAFLEHAWSAIAAGAAKATLAAVRGTERVVDHALLASALSELLYAVGEGLGGLLTYYSRAAWVF